MSFSSSSKKCCHSTQTYNFLIENKSIEDIKQQPNIEFKEKSRHGGKTYRIDNYNNKKLNDEQIQNISENLEPVTSNLINNEKGQEIKSDIWTKFKNYLNWPSSNTEELIQTQKKYIEQKDKEMQQLKTENQKSKVKHKAIMKQIKKKYLIKKKNIE